MLHGTNATPLLSRTLSDIAAHVRIAAAGAQSVNVNPAVGDSVRAQIRAKAAMRATDAAGAIDALTERIGQTLGLDGVTGAWSAVDDLRRGARELVRGTAVGDEILRHGVVSVDTASGIGAAAHFTDAAERLDELALVAQFRETNPDDLLQRIVNPS